MRRTQPRAVPNQFTAVSWRSPCEKARNETLVRAAARPPQTGTSALLVTGVSLVLAMLGLSVIDALRYRATAREDAVALARVIAENTSAAVAFRDADAAREILASVRVRDVVTRACVYLPMAVLRRLFHTDRHMPTDRS